MPSRRSRDAAGLLDRVKNALRSTSSPIAEPPPVGGQHGRDQRADDEVLAADLVGELLEVVLGRVDVGGSDKNRSMPSNRWPLTSALAVHSSICSNGSAVLGAFFLADEAWPAALWSLGQVWSCPWVRASDARGGGGDAPVPGSWARRPPPSPIWCGARDVSLQRAPAYMVRPRPTRALPPPEQPARWIQSSRNSSGPRSCSCSGRRGRQRLPQQDHRGWRAQA